MTPDDYECRTCHVSLTVTDGMEPLEDDVRYCPSCAIDEIERLQRSNESLQSRLHEATKAGTPYAADRDAMNALVVENQRLQGIVDLLPKDAEGNPLFVGMRRWVSDVDSLGPFQGWETITQLRQRANGEWEVICKTCDTTAECCWSSMETAEKARQSNG